MAVTFFFFPSIKPRLYVWDYTANLLHPFTPEPRAFVFGPDLRLYRRMGAISVFCEHNHGSSPVSDFDAWHVLPKSTQWHIICR